MLFNSYIFVLLFLPCTLFLYYFLNKINKFVLAKVALVLMSLWFYAYFRLDYIFVILASIIVNYTVAGLMKRSKDKSKLFLVVGIILDVLLIFFFKYLDFTLENINFLFKCDIPMMRILMPLGISFFTFQQIGYLVDSYNGVVEDRSFLDYVLFVTFFPQLIAGPIVSYNEMVPQFKDENKKVWNFDNFSLGLFWFAAGMAKKVLIADNLGVASDWGYANVTLLNGPEAIMTFVLYTFRLYFDFSGYCDMACGIAKMFGIDLPINFLSPLKSLSIMEFWNKWHITLGRFLTGYLFNPMVTNFNRRFLSDRSMDKEKKKRIKSSTGNLFLFLTFFISGIWHGANWTYILWGVFQGVGRVLYQIFRKKYDKWPKAFRWIVNFVFNVFSMGLFGAATVKDYNICLSKLFCGWKNGISYTFYNQFNFENLVVLEAQIPGIKTLVTNFSWMNMFVIVVAAMGIALFGKNIYEMKNEHTKFAAVGTVCMLTMSILCLTKVTTFLYFNF